ncbi:helix-turn-helix domain-containing protein [Flavobacterium geliluteum]|uniref:Helix-turn-helix transcriptional regulator n=1 Tax=Flavobacterium geliluteum TaxID=2816120 RepID=A0A940X868_9FLAO|nr:AraC family transcriptional regulator [Flavobacterium geliluteum]MBP4137242.1 helix-turn-helix transcriptional regulator [Flavobacterium geliluteum]
MLNKKIISPQLGLKIHLLENFASKASANGLFKESYFSIIMVNSGSVCIQVNDNKETCLSVNDLIVVPIKAYCCITGMNDPLQLSVVSFTSEFAYKNSLRRPHIGYFELYIEKYHAKVSLKKKDVRYLMYLLQLLYNKAQCTDKAIFKKERLLLSFNLMLYELATRYNKYHKKFYIEHTVKEKMVIEFFRILEANYKNQHSVKYYADVLCMTSDHLTKIVKEGTQKSAKQFIVEAIIMESKQLLQNEDINISTIAEELQFGSSSLFSNFFKKHTALSPSAYRTSLNLE